MNKKGISTLRMCQQKLNYLNYSKRTEDNYLSHISKFLKSQEKSALHLNAQDFQSYLDGYKFTSISQQNRVRKLFTFILPNN